MTWTLVDITQVDEENALVKLVEDKAIQDNLTMANELGNFRNFFGPCG